MKKLLFISFFAALLAVGCDEPGLDDDGNLPPTEQDDPTNPNSPSYNPSNPNNEYIPWNEILYTSVHGGPLFFSRESFICGTSTPIIISNTYINGIGHIVFDNDITEIISCPKEVESLSLSDGVRVIRRRAFNGNDIKTINIGSGVEKIEERAFQDCSLLTGVNIADGVKVIGEYAFFRCTSLKNIVLPESITTIDTGAFEDCSNLTSVTIGSNVTNIGDYVFLECHLTTVYCKPTTPPTSGEYIFNTYIDGDVERSVIQKELKAIYVPRKSVDAYKAAKYWSEYAHLIKPYDF